MATILYLGKLVERVGASSETLDLPPSAQTSESLREWLDTERELQGELLERTVRIAVNGEITAGDIALSNGDEIAFLPPVGGG